jgi:hypothetical protein
MPRAKRSDAGKPRKKTIDLLMEQAAAAQPYPSVEYGPYDVSDDAWCDCPDE